MEWVPTHLIFNMAFKDPLVVSSGSLKDRLKIVDFNSFMFTSNETGEALVSDFPEISVKLPK